MNADTCETCETCRHWGRERVKSGVEVLGTCRVIAPSAGARVKIAHPEKPGLLDFHITRGEWNWTKTTEWCGRHE